GDWHGKAITAHGLSRLLKPYRIRTMTVKVDGHAVKGYKAEQFEDAWLRVVGVTRVTRVTSEAPSQAARNPSNPGNPKYREGLTVVGDPDSLEPLAEAHRNGHVAEAEAEQRHAVHKLLAAAQ